MAIRKSWVVEKRGKVWLTKHGIRQCFLIVNRLPFVRSTIELLDHDCDAAFFLIHKLAAECALADVKFHGLPPKNLTRKDHDRLHKAIALSLFSAFCDDGVKRELKNIK